MNWKTILAIVVVVLVALYSIIGFLIIPKVAESVLPKTLTEHLQRAASVRKVSFNPYTLAISVEGLTVQDKQDKSKHFIAMENVFINLQWKSLFTRRLIAKEIRVDTPRVRIARVSPTRYTFSDLLSPEPSRQTTSATADNNGINLHFTLSNISISEGEISYRDEPMGQTHHFSGIDFHLPQISNIDAEINTYAQPIITGTLNNAQVRVSASTSPFADSMATTVNINLTDVSLPRYFEYVPQPQGFAVTDGSLDIKSTVALAIGSEGNLDCTMSARADCSGLILRGNESAQLLSVPQLHITMQPSRILQNQVLIESLRITEPILTVIRRAGGELNLADVGLPQIQQPQESAPEDAAFDLQMASVQLQSGTLRIRDFAAPGLSTASAAPVEMHMEDIELEVTDFANTEGQQADLEFSATLPTAGTLAMAGTFGAPPLRCNMEINLEDLDLKQAQPYLPASVPARIAGGLLHISGNAQCRAGPDDGMNAVYKGNMSVSDLEVIEEHTRQALTTLQSFAITEMDVSLSPARVDIQRISVSGFQQRLAVDNTGQLNIARILKQDSVEPAAHKKTEDSAEQDTADAPGEQGRLPIPLSIGEIELADMGISFTDRTITPTYSSEFSLTEGSITGLSTADTETDVFLKGTIDKHAAVTIEGTAAPLVKDIMIDVIATLENLELSPLSPYARKFIGRNVERGKLNIDMDYVVKDKQLEAENHVRLDELSLGQQVQGGGTIDLPVSLIVSLLKGRNGQIELTLPLSGRLDDPQFSMIGIVSRSLRSIFMDAATSPFAFASSLISSVSGGEELRYIEFKAGSSDLTKSAGNKLRNVRTLLYERPKLDLVLTGYVNPEQDRQALAEQKLEDNVRAALRQDSTTKDKDEDIPDTEDIKLTEEQYSKYLHELYKQTVLADEDTTTLADEDLTVKEMQETLRQRITVKDGQLRQLAERRRDAVKTFVLQDERISKDRLFTRRAESLAPPDPGEFNPARVQLDLQ